MPSPRAFLVVATLVVACNNSSLPPAASDPGRLRLTTLASGTAIHLRTYDGHYVVAERGGGAEVRANRTAAGPWETFTLLTAGSKVVLRTSSGAHYLQASGGGGRDVNATSTSDGAWESFTLSKVGGGPIDDGDAVSLAADNGNYVVAEGGGGGVVNANRTAVGPWETFYIEVVGGAGSAKVRPDDTVLVPPRSAGPILGTVTGYEMNSHCPFSDPSHCELPIYARYDRDTDEWWDILVQELLHSRVNVVMAHGRGCYDVSSGTGGNGNMCPRLLSRLIAAIDRAGARDVLRLGMFDDTGAYQGARNTVESRPATTRFDLSDHSSWRFFWDHNMRIWFDTVPRDLWFRLDGKPVVAFWSLSSYFFSGQKNHASLLLRDLKQKFRARYGEEPLFIVDGTWVQEDPSITTSDAAGVNDWFDPTRKNYTFRSWGGFSWGATVPGFRDPDYAAGCGAACREYTRRDGASLREALTGGASAKFMLLEGWTDVAESAGYYRSSAWRFPNQYIEIVRQTADPTTPTLRLEAEAADELSDRSSGNAGGEYRSSDLDIGRIGKGGWHVGWTESGEWLRWKEVAHACGTYRYTARIATPLDGQRIRLRVGGSDLGEVAVPNTGGWDSYELLHLGERAVASGRPDLTVEFATGGVNLDWVFVKKSVACP